MITSVRFPSPVAVVGNDPRVEWKPGERGVLQILTNDGLSLRFSMEPDRHEIIVVAPPGTVIVCSPPPDASGFIEASAQVTGGYLPGNASGLAEPREEAHEPTPSPPSDSPPPARPIQKSGRVRR